MYYKDVQHMTVSGKTSGRNLANTDVTVSSSIVRRRLIEHEGRKEMFYLTTHSTHFIYDYMASDIW